MQSFVILIIIYGANGDNIHKGLDSALQKWGGHLSGAALKRGVDLDPTFKTLQNSVEYLSHPQCPRYFQKIIDCNFESYDKFVLVQRMVILGSSTVLQKNVGFKALVKIT